MTDLERHRLIHLVASRGYDPRTVARVLDGCSSKKRLVYERVRRELIDLGVQLSGHSGELDTNAQKQ
jgi:hypothetical protein